MQLFEEIILFKHLIYAYARAERQKHLYGSHFKAYVVRRRAHFGQSERTFVYARIAVNRRDNNGYTYVFAVNEEFFEVCLFALGANRAAVVQLNHNRLGLFIGKAVKIEIKQRMRLNRKHIHAQPLRRACFSCRFKLFNCRIAVVLVVNKAVIDYLAEMHH